MRSSQLIPQFGLLLGLVAVVSARMYNHLEPSAKLQSDNELLTTGYDCLQPPADYGKRTTCCQPLADADRQQRFRQCVQSHRDAEQRLADKIAELRAATRLLENSELDAEPGYQKRESLFDCFLANSSEEQAAGWTTTTTAAPWVSEGRTGEPTSSASAEASDEEEVDLDVYRAATLDVMMCTVDDGANATTLWKPIFKRAFDECSRDYRLAGSAERQQYRRFRGSCPAGGIHVLSCMADRMFVECPSEYWAVEGDAEECDLWRRHVVRCPQNQMMRAFRRRHGRHHRHHGHHHHRHGHGMRNVNSGTVSEAPMATTEYA